MEYTNLQNKYTIKIPENIITLYCDKTQIVTFIGPLKKKSLKTEVKLFFVSNLLIVSNIQINRSKTNNKKTSQTLQGSTLALIKHILIEINYKLYHKLKFVGVGYRVFQLDNPLENQIFLKLGYSHVIYFKIPKPIQTHHIKFTKLFIYGNCSYNKLTKLASAIRDCKLPEPYKGKGILHYGEKILLKKGKKI